MNYKPLLLMGGLFVVLLAALFLVKPKRPEVTSSLGAGIGKALVGDFKVDDARAVKLTKGDREIRLAKKAGQWVVASKEDRPADDGRVTGLLNALRDAKIKEERVGSPETFDLDEKHRLTVEVSGPDDKSLAKIVAGKAPDFGSAFVLDGEPARIVLVDQNFADKAQVKEEDEKKILAEDKWYDLKLLRITSGDVIDVAFQKGDQQKWRIQKVIPGEGPVKPQPKDVGKKDEAKAEPAAEEKKDEGKKADEPAKDEPKAEAKKADEAKAEPAAEEKKDDGAEKKDDEKKEEEKKEPVWRVTEPEDAEADESECNSVCSALAWLDAKGYADEIKPEEQGFDKPEAITRVVLKDGTTHTLTFGKFVKDEKNDLESFAIVKLDDKPQVWKITKYNYESLTKPLDKLKKAKEEKKDEKADEEKKDGEGAAKAEEKKDEKATEKPEEKKEDGAAPKAEEKTDEPKADEKAEPAKKEAE